MLIKILFTLAVVVLVVAVVRFRQRPAVAPESVAKNSTTNVWVRNFAIGVLVVMLSGAVLLFYLHWREGHQLMQVRIIDSNSGRISEYQVYRKQLGERHFKTQDGRQVSLAETERMEVSLLP